MRYKNDSGAAALCYLSIVLNVVQFIAFYSNNTVVPNLRTGADVVINIVFMLLVFWASEMVKVYDRKWAAALVGIGALQALRVLWLPAYFHELEQLVGPSYDFIRAATVLSGISLAAAAALSFSNATILRKYMKTRQAQEVK
jgi:hypothetical protein